MIVWFLCFLGLCGRCAGRVWFCADVLVNAVLCGLVMNGKSDRLRRNLNGVCFQSKSLCDRAYWTITCADILNRRDFVTVFIDGDCAGGKGRADRDLGCAGHRGYYRIQVCAELHQHGENSSKVKKAFGPAHILCLSRIARGKTSSKLSCWCPWTKYPHIAVYLHKTVFSCMFLAFRNTQLWRATGAFKALE